MDNESDRQAPFEGIRVIDFGHYIAGPLTGMLLADQGAEVIKIDRPGRPDYDSPANAVFNRGKERVTLDLKNTEDLASAKNLVEAADVVIENFRPGVMERLGLGAKQTTASNPRLVYLSLPGFASSDDEKASIRAFEGVVGAATGVFTNIRRNPSPVYTSIPMGSTYGAIHGAIAVTLALYARQTTGRGDVIEVPLVGAAMSAMAMLLFKVENLPRRYTAVPGDPLYRTFHTADGKMVYVLAAGHSRNSSRLLKALGVYETLVAEGMVDESVYDHLNLDNNIPDSGSYSPVWKDRIRELLEAKFLEKPAAYWVEKISAAGVPANFQRTTQEWLHTPEAETAGLVVVVDDVDYGAMRQLGIQVHISGTPEELIQPGAARPFIRDADELSRRDPAKCQEGDARADASGRQILEGLRVLDLSNVLAGPCSTRTLAEYGADVIKIDMPDPYFGPRVHSSFPIEVSPGKRSMVLDLKSEEGLKIFWDLVKAADVIVHNFRPGAAEHLGIDYESVKQRKRDIVYLNISALDGPRPGPWRSFAAFDPVIQAATGIQVRYGGEGHPPVLHGWAATVDYITGYSGTFGIALGLLIRKRSGSGEGSMAKTSLAQGAQLVQAPFMYASKTHSSGDEPQGQLAMGEHALHRIYRAADGHLFLAGTKSDLNRLDSVSALTGVPVKGQEDEAERARFLEQAIEKQPIEFWIDAFTRAGLGCHAVNTVEDIRREYRHEITSDLERDWDDGRSISVVRFSDHPVGGYVDVTAPAYARLENAPLKLGAPWPPMGADTREVLQELGYDQTRIDTWVSNGIVKEKFHSDYLPV